MRKCLLLLLLIQVSILSCKSEFKIDNPSKISSDKSGNLYLLQRRNRKFIKFSKDGFISFILAKRGRKPGTFFDPFDFAVDDNGYSYICNRVLNTKTGNIEREEVYKFDPSGKFLKTIFVSKYSEADLKKMEYLYSLSNIATHKENIYLLRITKEGNKEILIMDNQGKIHKSFFVDITTPGSLAISTEGIIYITDSGENSVAVINQNGEKIREFGGTGKIYGKFRYPFSIGIDNNLIYVCDVGNRRIQKLKSNGEFILEFERPSPELNKYDIALESLALLDNEVIVTDSIGNRILIYDKDGKLKKTIHFLTYKGLPPGIFITLIKIIGIILALFLITLLIVKIIRKSEEKIGIRILILFMLTEILVVFGVGGVIYKFSYENYKKEMRNKLLTIAQMLANEINGDDIENIEEIEDTKYQDILKKFKKLNKIPEAKPFEWIGVYKIEGKNFYYGVDIEESGVYYPFFEVNPHHLSVLSDGKPRYFEYGDEWGEYFSAVAPVRNSNGKIVTLIEISRDLKILKEYRNKLLFKALIIMIFGLVLASALSFVISTQITQPIKALSAGVNAIEDGRYDFRIQQKYKHELGRFINTFNKMVDSISEKEKIRSIMNKVVSKEVAKELLRGKIELGGIERRVSILFSDIRSFTTISEKMAPQELVSFLNEYFSHMSLIIDKEGGIIDKYIGDAIMAIFGAPFEFPDDCLRAVRAGLGMIEALEDFNKKRTANGDPKIKIGIGINSGIVVAGNVGSENRLNYTVIGDAVNLSSRLEGLTKLYGVEIIISEEVYNQIKDEFIFRELDIVKVKGKTEAIKIYEVFDESTDKDKLLTMIDLFSKAMIFYRKQDWDNATEYFNQVLKISPEDKPTKLYLMRINNYKKNPISINWDGVFIADEK